MGEGHHTTVVIMAMAIVSASLLTLVLVVPPMFGFCIDFVGHRAIQQMGTRAIRYFLHGHSTGTGHWVENEKLYCFTLLVVGLSEAYGRYLMATSGLNSTYGGVLTAYRDGSHVSRVLPRLFPQLSPPIRAFEFSAA